MRIPICILIRAPRHKTYSYSHMHLNVDHEPLLLLPRVLLGLIIQCACGLDLRRRVYIQSLLISGMAITYLSDLVKA